jgi:putative endonuclease
MTRFTDDGTVLRIHRDESAPYRSLYRSSGDLKRRIHQHREKLLPGFTHRYNVSKLVYYECTEDASAAIAREKQIKAGSRRKKIELVSGFNPEWRELYDEL